MGCQHLPHQSETTEVICVCHICQESSGVHIHRAWTRLRNKRPWVGYPRQQADEKDVSGLLNVTTVFARKRAVGT